MSVDKILLPKIIRPRISPTYHRTELHNLIDETHSRQVVFVSGPPGAGKTSLIATYVESRNLLNIWYQVDECDKDLASFFHFLGIAASETTSRDNLNMPHLTPEFSHGLAAFTKRYFQELYRHLGTPFLIVLDNYQDVPEESGLHDVIRVAATELPEGCRVVIISRKECPTAMARLRAGNQVAFIEWEDLKLSSNEVKAISALHGIRLSSDDEAKQLQMKVGGWAAGLSLALQLKSKDDMTIQSSGALDSVVFDYFAEEIFNNLPPDIQRFMQHTAVLPVMSPQAIDQLIGVPRANGLVAEFAQLNYFTTKHGDQNPIFQYHPLFREFLLDRAEKTLSPIELKRIRHRAAAVMIATGHLEDGIRLFLKLKDWNAAAAVIYRHAKQLHEQGRHRTLESWLRMFDNEVVEQKPYLSYWLGMSLLFYDPDLSRPYFEHAYVSFQKINDAEGIFLSWAGVMDSIVYAYGDVKQADLWIDEMDELLTQYHGLPTDIAGSVSFTMFTAMMFWKPNHPRMPLVEERVRHMIASNIEPTMRMLLMMRLVKYCLWRGDIAQASIILETQRGDMNAISSSPFAKVMCYLVDAMYAMHAGLHDRCQKAVAQGLQLSEDTGIHMWNMVFLALGATTSFSMNNLDDAGDFIKEMASVFDKTRHPDASCYHVMAAWHAVMTDRPGEAVKHAEFAIKQVEQSGKPYFMSAFMLGMGLVYYWVGNVDTAEMYLQKARHIGKNIDSSLLEWVYLLFAAYLAIDQNRDESGIFLLKDAMRLGRENGYTHFFFWPRSALTKICGIALDRGIETKYVRRLIRQHNFLPDPTAPTTDKWPYPIKIYTLSRFNVLKDEMPIRFEGKAQRAPMNLLKMLIAFGGRDVSEQRLASVLWPESDGDAAQQSLATSLCRLRKLIGNDAIKRQEGRLSLDSRICWVDCWAFERLASEIDNDIIETCRMIKDIYHKPFLDSEENATWAFSMRERLHVKFIQVFSACGKELQRLNRHEEAICYYQRALEIDDLVENFYRDLMKSYAAIGQKTQSIRIYERAIKVFRVKLGIDLTVKAQHLLLSL